MTPVNTSLLDRLIALAPLGVLVYALRRHETTVRDALRAQALEQAEFRNERRELINRVQFPTRMPVAAVPMRPDDRAPSGLKPLEQVRADWGRVGHAAPPVFSAPTDADDIPEAN